MSYGKLVPLVLALGLGGAALTVPVPAQTAPLSGGLSAVAAAQPTDVITVQRRRGARSGRYHGRRGHWGHRGGGGVGAGIAAGIIGAAAGAIILNEAARRGPQCIYTNPYTGEQYYSSC
jgi:hypothetical protein